MVRENWSFKEISLEEWCRTWDARKTRLIVSKQQWEIQAGLNILGACLVNKAPNIREELNILAFKRRHVILNGGVMVFYEPRKKKLSLKKKKEKEEHFKEEY